MSRPERLKALVAVDWSSTPTSDVLDFGPVLDYVGTESSLRSYQSTRDETGRVVHRLTFDGRKVRHSNVHSVAVGAGFVCHIEED